MTRVGRVEPHLGEEQRGHEIRGRGARGRMTAAGSRRRANRIDAKSGRDVVEHGHEPGAILRHGNLRKPFDKLRAEEKSLSASRNAEYLADGERIRGAEQPLLAISRGEGAEYVERP